MTDAPDTFDHVLVGTGQATGTLLPGLPGDERIAVIEGGAVGGTCVNTGCTPTKTLVASARVAHLARHAGDYGVDVGPVAVDFAAAMARMNEVRHASRDGLTRMLLGMRNVTLIRGWARFVAPRTLRVGDRTVRGRRVYLNVGARPVVPPVPGLDDVPWLDTARLLELERRPEHLLVIGASYVALEWGQVLRRFGARVTVLEVAPRFLGREEPVVADAVREVLEGEGIAIEVGVAIERVARDGEGVRVVLGDGTERRGTHLLVAAGRRPNGDRLDLERAGVATDDRGHVVVDGRTRTGADGVFALGDVNGRGAFTHTSVHDAQVLLDLLHDAPDPRTIDERPTVYAMYTDPPLGRVGLTEAQAVERGHAVRRATLPMDDVSRAREMGETAGVVKLVVDAETDRILGASVFGVHGDEAIALWSLAIHEGITAARFRRAVHPHPTVAEMMPFALARLEPGGEEAGSRA